MQRLLLALLISASAASAATIFCGVFDPPNWTASFVSQAGTSAASFDIGQALTGGDPDQYRYDRHSMTANNGIYTSIGIFNRYVPNDLVLNTAITSLSYSYDLRLEAAGPVLSPVVGYRPALMQNGIVYHTVAFLTADSPAWTPKSSGPLTASNFCRATPGFHSGNETWDCSQNPSFAAGAPNISVGYVIANAFAGVPGSVGNYASGLDDFQVVSTGGSLTPEPSSLLLLLGGALLILRNTASKPSAKCAAPPPRKSAPLAAAD